MKLDCLLYLAYISFSNSDWSNARDHFNEAYFVARVCNEAKMAEQCLCNAGIASGNLLIEQPNQNKLHQTFYKTGLNFTGNSFQIIGQNLSESESEGDDSGADDI